MKKFIYTILFSVIFINDGSSDNSENVMPSDGGAENVAFEVSADSFLDFTESNPFGDPSENY